MGMETIVVGLHVIAAIMLMGPVMVATSMFAPQLRKVTAGNESAGTLRLLHKITRIYGLASAIVPVLGVIAMFTSEGALKDGRFHASILLAVIAWGLLVFLVIPRQRLGLVAANALQPADDPATEKETAAVQKTDASKLPGQAAMFGGIFNLLWVIIAILMVI